MKNANIGIVLKLACLLLVVFAAGLWIGRTVSSAPPTLVAPESVKTQTPPEMQEELKKAVVQPEENVRPAKQHRSAERPLGENRIAEIAAEAAPSVVNVETDPIAPASGHESKQPFALNPFTKGNPPGSTGPNGGFYPRRTQHPLASGSGLIVRSDGYVITNNHLVRPNCELKVTLNDQRSFNAKLVGRDVFTDLAVLKIDAVHLPVVPFGNSKTVRPGEWAIAIGNPLGFDHTVTLGIVSAINRSLADLNTHVDLIQTDAAINPGNSGGPLLDIDGQVIGITSAIRSDAQNIGFAIPVDVVDQVSSALIKTGTIVRPYLGVFMKDLDNRVIVNLNLPKDSHGVLILRVVPGSPAERAGIVSGDFIEKVDGVDVATVKEVRQLVKKHVPGDMMQFVMRRNGKTETEKLLVGNYPNEE
jgi:S1-C subfamily serine protease